MKNILSLSHDEALDFLMDTKQYCGFELPEYFVFNNVLANVRESIGDKPYADCVGPVAPDDVDGVNVDVVISKDGKHSIRKLILANPYLYYFLSRELCNEDSWQALLECFELFKVPTITVPSLPVVSERKEKFHRASTIANWWKCVEQRTISLSLDYRYMFVTDITNCYGSINPQSIEWALTRKGTQYATDENRELARNIQSLLRAMQHGHNVGIPMGSTLFDLVAEIVLGYADLLLYEELTLQGIVNYEIIRYRDDYRIFCNDKGVLEKISYVLQDVLGSLNFTFNAGKTKITDDVVTGAIKPDKLWDIYNTPVSSKKMSAFDTIQKHLLYILQFSRQFPNGGQLRTMLSNLDKMVEITLSDDIEDENGDVIEKERPFNCMFAISFGMLKEAGGLGGCCFRRCLSEDVEVLTAIATQIAVENITVANYALRLISRLIDSLDTRTKKMKLVSKVYEKLRNQPNTNYIQLWLQNLTYVYGQDFDSCGYETPSYDMPLCGAMEDEMSVELWNNSWLKPELFESELDASIVDTEVVGKLGPIICFRESQVYNDIELDPNPFEMID